MNASIVLSVVLGLVLLGAAAALIRRKRNPSSAQVRTARSGANRKELDTVALGLRAVAEGRAYGQRALPDVHAVLCSGQRLTLLLAGSDAPAPAPWTADVSGKEWSVEPADLRGTGGTGPGPMHPYALTVTLGVHGGDRVLVDLARLPGAIALTGDDADVLLLAQALITEIVSGPVGPHATVVLVGSAATASVTDGLGARSARLHTAADRREALTLGTLAARTGRASVGTPARRLFVVTAAQFRDERWGESSLRGTDALLVLGYIAGADWHLQVNPDGSLNTGRLGLPIDRHTACLH